MITRCTGTVILRFSLMNVFLRFSMVYLKSYEKRKALVDLKADSNKNLAYSHFFNLSFNATNIRRTTMTHKIARDSFICWSSFLSPQVKQN